MRVFLSYSGKKKDLQQVYKMNLIKLLLFNQKNFFTYSKVQKLGDYKLSTSSRRSKFNPVRQTK